MLRVSVELSGQQERILNLQVGYLAILTRTGTYDIASLKRLQSVYCKNKKSLKNF